MIRVAGGSEPEEQGRRGMKSESREDAAPGGRAKDHL